MSSLNRENNFNAIKLLAAFLVIAGHMYILTGAGAPTVWGHGVHTIGVYIFFLIGGYLVTKSWRADKSIKRYAAKRFFRIWPPLAVVILLTTFILGPCSTTLPLSEYFGGCKYYLRNLAFFIVYALPRVFESNPYPSAVNGSLWTLPVEMLMYAVVPIVVSALERIKSEKGQQFAVLTVTALVCFGDCYMLRNPSANLIIYGTDWVSALHTLPYYFIGMSFAFLPIEKVKHLPLVMLATCCAFGFNWSYSAAHVLMYFLLPSIVFSVAFAPSLILRKVGSRAEITYGIYLFGFPIQQTIVACAGKLGIPLLGWIYAIIAFAFSSVAAYGLFVFIEKPIQTKLHSVLSAKAKLTGA